MPTAASRSSTSRRSGRVETRARQPPIEDGNRCAVEILVEGDGGELRRPVDIFTVNDAGEIVSLRMYMGHALEEDRAAIG